MSSWKGLSKRQGAFEETGAMVVGVAADTPADLTKFKNELALPFAMLSDPHLIVGQELESPISTRKGFYGALALHPEVRHYPRKAFLQPAVFVWRDGKPVFEWRQDESIVNLFGARGRPGPERILEIARDEMR